MLYPMFALFVLSLVVLVLGFRARVRAIKTAALPYKYFGLMSGGTPPEDVVKTTRQFSNLFEAPVLFYTACLAAMVLKLESPLLLTWAWLYVAFRYAHAIIHIGHNRIYHRMIAYFGSWAVLTSLWITLMIAAHGM